jgi:hypothetical protein
MSPPPPSAPPVGVSEAFHKLRTAKTIVGMIRPSDAQLRFAENLLRRAVLPPDASREDVAAFGREVEALRVEMDAMHRRLELRARGKQMAELRAIIRILRRPSPASWSTVDARARRAVPLMRGTRPTRATTIARASASRRSAPRPASGSDDPSEPPGSSPPLSAGRWREMRVAVGAALARWSR